jgi:Ca-activated chloride channel homolog
VLIHMIGPDGSPFPYGEGGQVSGFKSDQEGNTRCRGSTRRRCKEIASAANGVYVRASNARNDLVAVFRRIEKMEKKEFGTKQFTNYGDRFQ